jgi:hypothetical protein
MPCSSTSSQSLSPSSAASACLCPGPGKPGCFSCCGDSPAGDCAGTVTAAGDHHCCTGEALSSVEGKKADASAGTLASGDVAPSSTAARVSPARPSPRAPKPASPSSSPPLPVPWQPTGTWAAAWAAFRNCGGGGGGGGCPVAPLPQLLRRWQGAPPAGVLLGWANPCNGSGCSFGWACDTACWVCPCWSAASQTSVPASTVAAGVALKAAPSSPSAAWSVSNRPWLLQVGERRGGVRGGWAAGLALQRRMHSRAQPGTDCL